jgi:hypothetical protein
MPARRRSVLVKKKNKSRKFGILFKIIIPVIIVVVSFAFFKLNTKYWNGEDKAAFVFPDSSGNVRVTVLDPHLSEETTLIIPGDTQVEVARGYGTLRIKNVWQLGINEKVNGALLAQTVTQNFHFPTMLWSASGLTDTRKFIFSPGKTNISLSDRILMAIFSLKVKSLDKTEIDLGKNQFLKKQNLADGASGYVLSGPVSGRLTVYFSDNNLAEKNMRFGLIDATGKHGVADGVGGILEVLGGKVISIDRRAADDTLDCVVLGEDARAVEKISGLFSCKKSGEKTDFGVEIRLGSKFAKRF